jgi:hypothetical protein
MLFVDEFDPHEPFDTPEPWQGMYEAEPWEGERLIWPPYVVGGRSGGHLSEAEARHVRANYGSKLSMIDHWFGRIIEQFDGTTCGATRPSSCAPTTGTTSVRSAPTPAASPATSGASRWCLSSNRSGTSRC